MTLKLHIIMAVKHPLLKLQSKLQIATNALLNNLDINYKLPSQKYNLI